MKVKLVRIDPTDNHEALRFLRRRTVSSEIVLAREPLQWHLRNGLHDRTQCCGAQTDVTDFVVPSHGAPKGYLKNGKYAERTCRCCKLGFCLLAELIPNWLAMCLDIRANQAAPKLN